MRTALAVFAVAAGSTLATASPVYAAPASVTDFSIDTEQPGSAWVEWTPSADTSSVIVCWRMGNDSASTPPPATPTDAGTTCSSVITKTTDTYYEITPVGGLLAASVFSYNPSTGEYGAPASGSVWTTYKPAMEPPIQTIPAGPHALTLAWRTPGGPHDDYLVSWSRGTSTQSPASGTVATVRTLKISSLASGAVYTFAVRGRDRHGIGPAMLLHAQTRLPGVGTATDATGTVRSSPPHGALSPNDYGTNQVAWPSPSGAIGTAYVSGNPDLEQVEKLHVASFRPGHGWSDTIVGRNGPEYGYTGLYGRVAGASARGFSALAFEYNGTDVVTRTSGSWSRQHKLSNGPLLAFTVDQRRGLHVVTLRGSAMHYVVRADGRTTDTAIAGTQPYDTVLLTSDRATDRIVVVLRHRNSHGETVRVASLAPNARKVSGLRTWVSTPNGTTHWHVRDVAANSGRIALMLGRFSGPADGPLAYRGVYVQIGTARSHGSTVHVPGTPASGPVADAALRVSLPTGNRVVLTWRRYDPSWRSDGIWLATRHRDSSTARWTFASPRRWRSSAYDQPLGAWADRDGHLHLAFVTTADDAPTAPPAVYAAYSE